MFFFVCLFVLFFRIKRLTLYRKFIASCIIIKNKMEVHGRNEKKSKLNNIPAGIGVGIAVPLLVSVLYWYARFYPQVSLGGMFTQFKAEAVMKMLSLCASPVLLVFYYFTKRNWNDGAKGLIISVVLLLAATLIIKL